MNISVFWARLIGLTAVILSIGFYIKHDTFNLYFTTLAQAPVIMMTMGVFTLILGLAIILSHPIWKGWALLVTLVGYWVCFKAIALIFFTKEINSLINHYQHYDMKYALLPAFIIGLILILFSFFIKEDDPL